MILPRLPEFFVALSNLFASSFVDIDFSFADFSSKLVCGGNDVAVVKHLLITVRLNLLVRGFFGVA